MIEARFVVVAYMYVDAGEVCICMYERFRHSCYCVQYLMSYGAAGRRCPCVCVCVCVCACSS